MLALLKHWSLFVTTALDLLDIDEVAERLGVRPRTVQRWHQAGRIPTVRITNKVIRFSWPDVVAALKKSGAKKE
jgi:excisionase family DNA binding protein